MAWTFGEAQEYGATMLLGGVVRLRGVRDSDVDDLVVWRQTPELGIFQAPDATPPFESVARERFAAGKGADDTRRGFAVETIPAAGDEAWFLGFVSLSSIDWKNRSAMFGISLRPDSGGHGYGADATRTMCSYAFRELGLHRIELSVWAFNERAITTYRRVGFVEEGRRRDVGFHDGRWHDELVMGLLSGDLSAR